MKEMTKSIAGGVLVSVLGMTGFVLLISEGDTLMATLVTKVAAAALFLVTWAMRKVLR